MYKNESKIKDINLKKIHAFKTRLKITQLKKACFTKVNELKLTLVGLFWFFHFMCVAADAFELFCKAHFANFERFLYHSNISL